MSRLLDMRGQVPLNTVVAFLRVNRFHKIWIADDRRRLDRWIRFGAMPSRIILNQELWSMYECPNVKEFPLEENHGL